MRDRYRMYRRKSTGAYYAQDGRSGKQESLHTKCAAEARRLVAARNQAAEQPVFNLAMARVYLSGRSPDLMNRTWADVLAEMALGYEGATAYRFRFFCQSAPMAPLKKIPLVETENQHFLTALRHPRAGSSTNKWLRIVHNRALDLGWLLSPVLARKCWPAVKTGRTVAITLEQHRRLLETEPDGEFSRYLELLWETGGAQTDVASLHRDNVDLVNRRMTFNRRKLEHRSMGHVAIVIGESLERILAQLPAEGFLFPTLATQNDKVRASRFRKRCDRLGYEKISLHSYRYAWAQRAKSYGMPLREAMAHLGHGSKAVHRAYSESAEIVTLPLEYYERQWKEKIVQFTPEPSLPKPADAQVG